MAKSNKGGVRVERTVRRETNNFQNGNSSKLPNEVTRCIGITCAKRDCCLRFLDSPTGNPMQSYADLSTTIENGHCSYMIMVPTGNPETWQSV